MVQAPIDDVDEQNQVERVRLNPKMSVEVKKSMMTEVRKSFSQKKQSSMKTILSLTNTMVGSAILVLPLKFFRAGYGSCIMAVILMGIFYCLTGRTIAFHLKSEEKDYLQSIERVLGRKWKTVFIIASQGILWLGAIIYFLVVSNILYAILGQLIGQSNLPPKTPITYSEFSFQWTGFILLILCFFLFNLRDLKLILKLSSKGIYCIAVYFLLITYLAIRSIAEGKVSFAFEGTPSITTIYFTQCGVKSLLQALGVFALSFNIHNLISSVLKSNKFQKKNPRDLSLAFGLGVTLLIYAGFVGLLAVFWRQIEVDGIVINAGNNSNTVMDLFDNSDKFTLIFLIISEALLVLQLMSVVAIIGFLARTQLFNMIYGADGIPPEKMIYIFAAGFSVVLYIFQIFNLQPMILIEFAGTIGGFVIAFLIPVALHLKAVHRLHSKKIAPSELDSATEIITQNYKEKEQSESFLSNISDATIFREEQESSKTPVWVTYAVYGCTFVYGVALIIIQFAPVEC